MEREGSPHGIVLGWESLTAPVPIAHVALPTQVKTKLSVVWHPHLPGQALNYLLRTLESSGCHICQLDSCWPKQTPQWKVLLPGLVVSPITTMALSGQTGQVTVKQWHCSPVLHQRMDWSSDNKGTAIMATKLSIITQWVVPLRFMQCWLPFCCTSQTFLCTMWV